MLNIILNKTLRYQSVVQQCLQIDMGRGGSHHPTRKRYGLGHPFEIQYNNGTLIKVPLSKFLKLPAKAGASIQCFDVCLDGDAIMQK